MLTYIFMVATSIALGQIVSFVIMTKMVTSEWFVKRMAKASAKVTEVMLNDMK